MNKKKENKQRQEKRPLVSVVLAVRNGEKYIRQALQSIVNQTYDNLEIVIIDGQSTDDTKTIVQSFTPKVRYIVQSNTGIANAYNLGVEKAKGEFITFIGHDDWWEVDKLKIQLETFQENPSLQYVVGKAKYLTEGGKPCPQAYKKEIFEEPPMAFIPETLMVRKSLFDQIGYFNPAYSIAEDVEWFLLLKEKKIPYTALDKILVNKRIHGENASLKPDLHRQLIMKMMRSSIHRKRTLKANSIKF